MATQQVNIINDISNYTRIPIKALNTIVEKEELCIGAALNDAKMNNEDIAVLNIGLGTLSIDMHTMECKFIPSKEFKSNVKHSIVNGVDPVLFEVESAMKDKLIALTEELL